MRHKLALCSLPLIVIPGCTAQFNWPANLPKHIDFSWTAITVSYPVVIAGLLVLIVLGWFKRKIRDAKNGKREN